MRIQVEVTQDDIDHGIVKHCFLCPISIAVKRALKCENAIAILATAIKINGKPGYIALPREAQRFVQNFDSQEHVSPFHFDIETPEESTEVEVYKGD